MKSGPDVFADALVPGKLSFPERPVPGTIPFPECSPSPELRSPAHQASGSEIFPASYRSFAGVGCFASACCCRRVIAREFGIRLAVNPRMVERSCATPGHLLEPVIARRVTACPVTNSGRPRPCGNGYRSAKPQGKPNFTIGNFSLCRRHFCDSAFDGTMRAFTSRSSRTLNCPSNLIGHDHAQQQTGKRR